MGREWKDGEVIVRGPDGRPLLTWRPGSPYRRSNAGFRPSDRSRDAFPNAPRPQPETDRA